jgi:hypothetical protein
MYNVLLLHLATDRDRPKRLNTKRKGGDDFAISVEFDCGRPWTHSDMFPCVCLRLLEIAREKDP